MIHKFKCILDKNNRVDLNSNIFKQGEVFIANRFNTNIKNDNLDLKEVLSTLYKKGICSVFVECGGTLAGAFLKEDLVDEICQFIAPKITNDNSSLSCFNGNSINNINECKNLRIYETQFLDPDILIKSIVI
jgi:riboflavin biosynthesis pyrimidine reductase